MLHTQGSAAAEWSADAEARDIAAGLSSGSRLASASTGQHFLDAPAPALPARALEQRLLVPLHAMTAKDARELQAVDAVSTAATTSGLWARRQELNQPGDGGEGSASNETAVDAADGATDNSTDSDTANVTVGQGVDLITDGRCTEVRNSLDPYTGCSGNLDLVACVNQSSCRWKYTNDSNFSCFCSFTECKCGDPAEGYYETQPYDPATMILTTIPGFFALGCVCLAMSTNYVRHQLFWLLGLCLPCTRVTKVRLARSRSLSLFLARAFSLPFWPLTLSLARALSLSRSCLFLSVSHSCLSLSLPHTAMITRRFREKEDDKSKDATGKTEAKGEKVKILA